ncbi:MAG: PCRF domain-containing protein, partial [Alphaproteobacteria bacterium]|nr:PCRF domain-containing protein [Alphaproteobacteria bacterium]
MNFDEKLSQVVSRFEEVNALLSTTSNPDELVKLNKEFATLSPVVEIIEKYQAAQKNMHDAEQMLSDESLDKEMRDLASEEYYSIKEELPQIEHDIKVALLPKSEDDEKNAILEVRAGTGGDEAALFAAVLFEM